MNERLRLRRILDAHHTLKQDVTRLWHTNWHLKIRVTALRNIGKIFLTGLATVVPITVTAYFIFWLFTSSEKTLGKVFRYFLPDGWYLPGLGVLTAIGLIFCVGILMRAWIVKTVYGMGEKILYKIPLVGSLYGSMRDLFTVFSGDQADSFNQSVLVKMDDKHLMGLVTRSDLSDWFPDDETAKDQIAVYLPMSYNMGGYMILVKRDQVQVLDMPVEEMMRIAITAGVTSSHSKN